MNKKKTNASMRIHSKILSCDEITKLLKIDPDKFFNKGEKISIGSSLQRDNSLWILSSKLSDDQTLHKHIENILDKLDAAIGNFELFFEKIECDIFCFYSTSNGQGSIEIDKELMKRISKYPIDLIIDLYVTDENEL